MQNHEHPNWTEAEDNALRVYYPRHGTDWDGWAEVLPGRTRKAIGGRAARIGVTVKRAKPIPKPKRKVEVHQQRSVGPSGYDKHVRRCMEQGMSPSQIDSMMGWWPGKAVRILTTMWDREAER